MNWQKCGVVGLLVGAGASSFASFELLNVLDRTDKVVYRYDAESGVYLGSFGAGYIQDPLSMALDQNTQTAYVLQNRTVGGTFDYITKFNYNTGAYLGTIQLQVATASGIGLLNDGRVMAGFYAGDVSLINSSGNETNWVSAGVAGASAFYGLAQDGYGKLYALNANGVIYGWSNPFAINGAAAGFSLGGTSAVQSRGQVSALNDRIVAANLTALIYAQTAPGGGFFMTSSVITGLVNKGTAIGHNNMMYVSGPNGGTGWVQRYDQWGNFSGSFGSAQLKDPVAMGIVVAPEPGTMVALGAGIVVFLRRRRSKL